MMISLLAAATCPCTSFRHVLLRSVTHMRLGGAGQPPRAATRLAPEDPAIRPVVVLDELHAHGGVLELGGHTRGSCGTRRAGRAAARPPQRAARPAAAGLPRPPAYRRLRRARRLRHDAQPGRDPRRRRRRDADLGPLGGGHHAAASVATPTASRSPPPRTAPASSPCGDKALVRATRPDGRVTLGVETRWACARRQRTALGGLLVLSGELRMGADEPVLDDNKQEFQVLIDYPVTTPLLIGKNWSTELASEILKNKEVEAVQIFAGGASPYSFSGMVKHTFLKESADYQNDLQIVLSEKENAKNQATKLSKVSGR